MTQLQAGTLVTLSSDGAQRISEDLPYLFSDDSPVHATHKVPVMSAPNPGDEGTVVRIQNGFYVVRLERNGIEVPCKAVDILVNGEALELSVKLPDFSLSPVCRKFPSDVRPEFVDDDSCHLPEGHVGSCESVNGGVWGFGTVPKFASANLCRMFVGRRRSIGDSCLFPTGHDGACESMNTRREAVTTVELTPGEEVDIEMNDLRSAVDSIKEILESLPELSRLQAYRDISNHSYNEAVRELIERA